MSTFVMTYRTPAGLRLQPLLAASMAQAWDRAFDIAQQLGGELRGFGVRRIGASA